MGGLGSASAALPVSFYVSRPTDDCDLLWVSGGFELDRSGFVSVAKKIGPRL
jgi:hypothetical protein